MDIISKINKIYHEINKIYQQLCNLEINGGKDSNYFLELVRTLRRKMLVEKGLCNQLIANLSNSEYDKLFNDLEKNESFFGERLVDYLKFHNYIDAQIFEDDDEDTIETINYFKLLGICHKNIYLIYLSFLQEYIDARSFSDIRKNMLYFKYYNAFKNHDIEKLLIDGNFSVDRINYINMYFLADTINLDEELKANTIFGCYFDIITTTVSQILSFNDIDYNDNEKRAIIINNQCMLRGALAITSESEYEKIKNDIYELIDNLGNDNSTISVMIIKEIISGRKNDKRRVKKISMRPLLD